MIILIIVGKEIEHIEKKVANPFGLTTFILSGCGENSYTAPIFAERPGFSIISPKEKE